MADPGVPEPILLGTPLGTVWPPQALFPAPDKSARYFALRALRSFIANLVFRRTGAQGQPSQKLIVPESQIYIEQPDNVADLVLPAMTFICGQPAYYDFYGLGPIKVIDSTRGIAGPNTALAILYDHYEVIKADIFTSKRAERRAILAGLEQVFVGADRSAALLLQLPDYFNLVASYDLDTVQVIDDADVVQGRRRALLGFNMRVPVVGPFNFTDFRPMVEMPDNVVGENVVIDLSADTAPSP